MRKAREQIKVMVKDGVSLRKISLYLHRWGHWWVRTSGMIWGYVEMLRWFLAASWDFGTSAIACQRLLRLYHITTESNEQAQIPHPAFEVNRAAV